MKQRSDYGSKAEQYFSALDESIRPLALDLRNLIVKALPEASESIKWGVPVYEQDGLVCAIRATREYIALQFYTAGISLNDPDGLLEGTGKKLRHIKIRKK